MPSIVITEIKASLLRHRLLDRLAGRADIIAPHALAPALARRIPRFLVAGLDDDREPGTGGWPIFTGGRYVKLCFSPVFDGTGSGGLGSVPHRLPLTEADYVRYVETITGLGANDADNLARIYRFDSAEIFAACRDMRTNCLAAWRLLLSNEFKLAQGLWQNLRDPSPQLQFRYPLVDAFRIIADLERASLIMRHLARARSILNRPDFLDALGLIAAARQVVPRRRADRNVSVDRICLLLLGRAYRSAVPPRCGRCCGPAAGIRTLGNSPR